MESIVPFGKLVERNRISFRNMHEFSRVLILVLQVSLFLRLYHLQPPPSENLATVSVAVRLSKPRELKWV
jgi:hypothetical protein